MSLNGPWNRAMQLLSTTALCTAQGRMCQKTAAARFLYVLLAMMRATLNAQAQLRHRFLGTIWVSVRDYAKIGFQQFLNAKFDRLRRAPTDR